MAALLVVLAGVLKVAGLGIRLGLAADCRSKGEGRIGGLLWRIRVITCGTSEDKYTVWRTSVPLFRTRLGQRAKSRTNVPRLGQVNQE